MHILGNVINNSQLLIADGFNIITVKSDVIYNRLKNCNKTHKTSIVFKDDYSRSLNSNSLINKTGAISKRCGTPLLLNNINVLKPI